MKNWKLLLVCFSVVASMFCSCANSKPDDSTTVFQASSQNKQAFVDGKVVDSTVAVIKPTWGQAIYYANKSGNAMNHVFALLCFLAFGFTIYKLLQVSGITQTAGVGFLMLACVSGILYFWYGKASTVHNNNTKEIPVEVYKATVKDGQDSQVIWDSLYNENKLIGAASK